MTEEHRPPNIALFIGIEVLTVKLSDVQTENRIYAGSEQYQGIVSEPMDETIIHRIIPPKANAKKPINDESSDNPIILKYMVMFFLRYSSFQRNTKERKKPKIIPMARNDATLEVQV